MPSKSLIIIVLGMILSMQSFATTFQKMPLEQLIEESSSGAEVELKTKKSYKNQMGMILTDYSFKVLDGYNINESDMNDGVVTITMAGGTVGGITSFIDSAPEFAIGEKSFVLLRKIESKLYLSNFTMGKYKIEEVNGQTFYISTIFPEDADIGRVKKERMVDMMKMKFKVTRAPEPDSYRPATQLIQEKSLAPKGSIYEARKPAQAEPAEKEQEFCVAMWAFFALFAVSGATIWYKLKKGVSV